MVVRLLLNNLLFKAGFRLDCKYTVGIVCWIDADRKNGDPPDIVWLVVKKYICELPEVTDGVEPEVTFENILVLFILKLVIL